MSRVRVVAILVRVSVSICVAAVAAACGEGKAAAPEVPPAPALTSQRTQPRPPPPEERETKVLPLDSHNCRPSDTVLIDFTLAEVLGRCDSIGPTTRVLVTVLPRTTDPADYLRALSLRFCGDVISAEGPSGWKVEIERERGRSGVAADVTWESPDVAPHSKMPTSGQIIGFVVTLRGQWRRGVGYYVAFSESGGPASLSPHDCPYPFR